MSILDNKIIDLMKIENIATLRMAEQKNLAILIIAKNELSTLSKINIFPFDERLQSHAGPPERACGKEACYNCQLPALASSSGRNPDGIKE